MPEFKDMLKYFRMRAGLSQSELAEKLNVSPSRISMYEVGKREPDFETEEKIADFFNTDLNTLRGRDIESNNSLPIVKYYNKLNSTGKKEATKRVQELTYFPNYIQNEEFSSELSVDDIPDTFEEMEKKLVKESIHSDIG